MKRLFARPSIPWLLCGCVRKWGKSARMNKAAVKCSTSLMWVKTSIRHRRLKGRWVLQAPCPDIRSLQNSAPRCLCAQVRPWCCWSKSSFEQTCKAVSVYMCVAARLRCCWGDHTSLAKGEHWAGIQTAQRVKFLLGSRKIIFSLNIFRKWKPNWKQAEVSWISIFITVNISS